MQRTSTGLLHARADWISVIEALYERTADPRAWGLAVVEVLDRCFPPNDGGGVGMIILEHDHRRASRSMPFSIGIGRSAAFSLQADVNPLSRQTFDALFYSPKLALTHTEALMTVAQERRKKLEEMQVRWQNGDALGMVAHPEPGVIAFLARPLATPTLLARHERKLLSHITLHFESACRLRRKPDAIIAVVAPDGKILHRESTALSTTAISERVRRIERARGRKQRRLLDSMGLWEALVGGEASIVERFDGGARHYVLIENTPSRRKHRALTRTELEVVRMAARGMVGKLIAYGLGLSTPSVSTALASAAAKLGLSSRDELIRVASLLTDTPTVRVDASKLTSTEREIYRLVRLGLSNAEISRSRSRSINTVANQVASVLRKTQKDARRSLIGARPPEAEV